eukprot:7017124-Pyramimonas_sp.AAC.1
MSSAFSAASRQGRSNFAASELVLNSQNELEEIERPAGSNDVGVVTWRCKVNTKEYPGGRTFILVANDITHIGGSFSLEEHHMFACSVKYAQSLGVPLVFICANSGARVDFDGAVKDRFRVQVRRTPLFLQANRAKREGMCSEHRPIA